MGTSIKSRLALATMALLLDITVADIMIQPGYGKAGSGKNSLGNSESMKNQPMVQQPQQHQQDQMQLQQYSMSQNPTLQFLQQQHALQRNYLQQRHQDQQQQLLGLQQQELHDVAKQSSLGPSPGNEMVGHIWGAPSALNGAGGLFGGKLFSLGPLGLSSFTLPALGGFGMSHPMLLATHQNLQRAETNQPEKSVDESKPRNRREIRDSAESKKYRQRQSRPPQNGVETPTVKSKSDAAPENAKSSKSSGGIVGDVHREDNDNENVGSSGLLDPLGLMDKAESMIDDLRSGHLPNPMEMLNPGGGGGLLSGLPSFLNAANPMTNQNGNQPMLGQPQQYNPYQVQQANGQYGMMNQQRSPSQQPSGAMVGDSRHILPQPMVPHPMMSGSYVPYAARYGAYGSPYSMYVQPYSPMGPWARHSNLMNYQGSLIGAGNPATRDPAATPISGDNTQTGTQKADAQGKSSPMNRMNGGSVVGAQNPVVGAQNPVVGAQNPIIGGQNPGQFQPFPRAMNYQMMPAQNQMAGYYQALQAMGTNPMTGSPGPAKTSAAVPQNPQRVGAPNPMVGRMNEFYDPNLQSNYYNDNGQFDYNDFDGDSQRHRHPGFDFDDIFDTGYGHGGIHSGGYDRIYETTSVHGHPYGYGGVIPHHSHNHQSYIM